MKNKNLVDIAAIIVVLAIISAAIAYIALSRDSEETTGLEVVDIKITEPKPSIISDRSITIDHGESVTLNVTVNEIIARSDIVTVEIMYPS